MTELRPDPATTTVLMRVLHPDGSTVERWIPLAEIIRLAVEAVEREFDEAVTNFEQEQQNQGKPGPAE